MVQCFEERSSFDHNTSLLTFIAGKYPYHKKKGDKIDDIYLFSMVGLELR